MQIELRIVCGLKCGDVEAAAPVVVQERVLPRLESDTKRYKRCVYEERT